MRRAAFVTMQGAVVGTHAPPVYIPDGQITAIRKVAKSAIEVVVG